jgi:hypothetical protein
LPTFGLTWWQREIRLRRPTTLVVVRKDQLEMARRGVDVLLARLNDTGDSLTSLIAIRKNVDEARKCSDPLVTVAIILVRMLRDSSFATIPATLSFIRPKIFDETFADEGEIATDIDNVEQLIISVVSAMPPVPFSSEPAMVALIAQEFAIVAATELAANAGKHVNEIVAGLRVKLNNQGDDVQLSDRDAAIAAANKYTIDLVMRKSRQDATHAIVSHWNDAANVLHQFTTRDNLTDGCRDSLIAACQMAFTCASLVGGMYQLASQANYYAALPLLRQLVESEFIWWKFAQGAPEVLAWYRSTSEERRTQWRPATIYRDSNNNFRQKDYSNHCELGGHPTPIGTRVATGFGGPTVEAGLLGDLITHSRESWRCMMKCVVLLDAEHGISASSMLSDLASKFDATITEHAKVDLYGSSASYFSDPTDD